MSSNSVAISTRPSFGFLIALPMLLSLLAPMANASVAQEEQIGMAPEDVWSYEYANMIFPWADEGDRILQFKEYHTYETMKERMLRLTENNLRTYLNSTKDSTGRKCKRRSSQS